MLTEYDEKGQEMKDVREIAPGLENAGYPLEGVATTGQPEQKHLEQLAEAGYRTVLDLRTSEEDPGFDESETVRSAGMEYVNMPLEVKPEAFTDEVFDRARDLLADPERRPILVHCVSAVRVAPLLIPYLILDEGRSPDEAIEIASQVRPQQDELTDAAFQYADERRDS
jgi:protein tyrosine phosphatase (PTP) superfamily phosphohydrolase (DUF442 family)